MEILNAAKFKKLCEDNPDKKIVLAVDALTISDCSHYFLISDITTDFAWDMLLNFGDSEERMEEKVYNYLYDKINYSEKELINEMYSNS